MVLILSSLSALVLLASRAAPAGAPLRAAPAKDSSTAPIGRSIATEDEDPPPGAPADRELWKHAMDASSRILVERAVASRMQWQLKQGKFDDRLAALAAGASAPAEAKRLGELRERLAASQAKNQALLAAPLPFDPARGCRYEMLLLEGTMGVASKSQELAAARESTQACLDKVRPPLETMAESNRDLQRIVAETYEALSPSPPAEGQPATPAGAVQPAAGEAPAAPR